MTSRSDKCKSHLETIKELTCRGIGILETGKEETEFLQILSVRGELMNVIDAMLDGSDELKIDDNVVEKDHSGPVRTQFFNENKILLDEIRALDELMQQKARERSDRIKSELKNIRNTKTIRQYTQNDVVISNRIDIIQ